MFSKQISDAFDFATFANPEIKKAVTTFIESLEEDLVDLDYSMSEDAENSLQALAEIIVDAKEDSADELEAEEEIEMDEDLKPDFELDDDE